MSKMLEVDKRGRVSLGSLAIYNLYLVSVEDDGTIIMTPATVVPLTKKPKGK